MKERLQACAENKDTTDLLLDHDGLHSLFDQSNRQSTEIFLKHLKSTEILQKNSIRHIEQNGELDICTAVWEKSKSRHNDDLLKSADLAEGERPASRYNYWVIAKFLGCQIKNVYTNEMFVPTVKVGNFLKAVDEQCKDFELVDKMNFEYHGAINPPTYESIQLSPSLKEDFMTEGYKFYDTSLTNLVVNFTKVWGGMIMTFMTAYNKKDFNKELKGKVETWAKENNFLKNEKFSLSGRFLKTEELTWDDLKVKSELKSILIKTGEIATDAKKMKVSRGLLFIGPPGCGKTLTAKILMNMAKTSFIWVTSQDLSNHCSLSSAFNLAREIAPTILLFEDIDSYIEQHAIDLFKTELDGLVSNEGLCVILTTNFPERLPVALLDRPGRFHDICNYELPDKEMREELVGYFLPELKDSDLKKLVAQTEGFSGDHLRELVDFAKRICLDEGCSMSEGIEKSLDKIHQQRQLVEELRAKERQE